MKLFILLFVIIQLTDSLKSNDYCSPKHIECKGFYNKNHKYQTKCNRMKCQNNKLNYACGDNICAKSETDCKDYNLLVDYFLKLTRFILNPFVQNVEMEKKRNKIESFFKHIKECDNKINYTISSNDFCLNGKNCELKKKFLKGFGASHSNNFKSIKIDCECPIDKSFKCNQYCAIDSNACDYLIKSNNNNISNCGNDNEIHILY